MTMQLIRAKKNKTKQLVLEHHCGVILSGFRLRIHIIGPLEGLWYRSTKRAMDKDVSVFFSTNNEKRLNTLRNDNHCAFALIDVSCDIEAFL